MTSSSDKLESNEWHSYWDEASSGGEVFVGQNGQAHPDIAKWWSENFTNLPAGCKIVDLASGAGSVFKHVPVHDEAQLFAADVSSEALTLLQKRFPSASTQQCSADRTPYRDQAFDWVVSQFGVEYAGDGAFIEAVRILARGGQLRILCHIRDGYIDARNQAHLKQAQVITSSDFIPYARGLFESINIGKQKQIDISAAKFQAAEQQLAGACKTLPEGIHLHLYQGFRQMFENRQQYAVTDVTAWLDAMQADVDRNIHRLTHMCAAASSASEIAALTDRMRAAGCAEISYETLQIAGHDAPIAWAVSASK